MFRAATAFVITLLVVNPSFGKDKKDKSRPPLPADVLQAQTVTVVIDPDAGEPMSDPGANARAREDVEIALTKWNRFHFRPEGTESDLVITVRRGTGKNVSPTLEGGPIDQRPPIAQPTDVGVRNGGGKPPNSGAQGQTQSRTRIGREYGPAEDMMEVYRGGKDGDKILDRPPVWRYIAKDALHSPDVPAVDQFRKAIEESEKAAAKSTKQP